jgi:hypothetical protein
LRIQKGQSDPLAFFIAWNPQAGRPVWSPLLLELGRRGEVYQCIPFVSALPALAMRTFLSTHWKSILALIILVLLAVITMTPGSAGPDLPTRLAAHMRQLAAGAPNAAQHIEAALAAEGYQVRREHYRGGGQPVRNIEVSLSNLAPHARPERIFIIGAHYDVGRGANGSGSAAVLELARLLKAMQPGQGTELRFVFLANPAPAGERTGSARPAPERRRQRAVERGYPQAANFIAFAGTRNASAQVRQSLAAFRASSDATAQGLTAPAYVEGVTLSNRASPERNSYPALMITDTAFLRYPYFRTAGDPDDQCDYKGMARVVKGLARTIAALAGGART